MKNRDIFILVAVLVYAAFRLYMKYGKKDKTDSTDSTKSNTDSKFFSSAKEDEYEPYSKK
jgi:hypothetical protein